MRWYRVLLIAVVSFVISAEQGNSLRATATRSLRGNAVNYSFKDVDEGPSSDTDERVPVGEMGAINKLKSSKTLKKFTRSMTKAANSFSEKISPALPIKAKLQVWSNNGKSVKFVRDELKLTDLAEAAAQQTQNFKYYDDFVTSQLPIWAKEDLTPNEVIEKLGMKGPLDAWFKADPNFKYYDNYLKARVPYWSRNNVEVGDVVKMLNLNTLTAAARRDAVNFQYYDDFVASQLRIWIDKDLPVGTVMAKLDLDKLTTTEILAHPNYPYYKYFVKDRLKAWATEGTKIDDVAVKLGMGDLQGQVLKAHPNFRFLEKYNAKAIQYQEEGWLKQGRTTFDIWKLLEVQRVPLSILRTSKTYDAYRQYVNVIDNYIIRMRKKGVAMDELPRLTSKDATVNELKEKTLIWTSAKRPEWYVKFALGLDGLGENALKEAANYQFYAYYLKAVEFIP
ncbi:hypothetical protein P3T76_011599 [Phytophthora citrophthora]|uniref:RxLR effector protein n=1 Tax=Phytophthora citrophthora TaxID=4793 RepID=A0AAD9G8Q9_9STRA|nr:hypothetical protein P3T76_011599 [Phytophthora citrophthora]